MFKLFKRSIFIVLLSINTQATPIDAETKKTHLEDIFIWKISDELKLTVLEEKKFTEINRALNKKKSELNKKIQQSAQELSTISVESALSKHKKLIQDYNKLSIAEFDSMKKLLGTKKFIRYLKIKHELTSKIKSILASDKSMDDNIERKSKSLPPPKVIIEKNE